MKLPLFVSGRSNNNFCSAIRKYGLLSAGLCLLAACANDLEKIKEITATHDARVETGRNVEIHYTDKGRLKAKILAPELIQNQSEEAPYTEFSKGLNIYFYNEQGEMDSEMSANYGKRFLQEDEMIVRDDVVIVNNEGKKLNTEELIWKQADHKIYSDKFVKITTPDEIIYGDGFEAKEDFSDYQIKNIKGIISVEADDMEEDL